MEKNNPRPHGQNFLAGMIKTFEEARSQGRPADLVTLVAGGATAAALPESLKPADPEVSQLFLRSRAKRR